MLKFTLAATALCASALLTVACGTGAGSEVPTPIVESIDAPAIDAVTGYMDPVCQMKIAEDAPQRYTHEGVTYGFCSSSCRERFEAEPATYLAAIDE